MGQRILLVGAECLWFESNVERSTETRRRQMPISVCLLYTVFIFIFIHRIFLLINTADWVMGSHDQLLRSGQATERVMEWLVIPRHLVRRVKHFMSLTSILSEDVAVISGCIYIYSQKTYNFYRAMLCIPLTVLSQDVCLPVHLSVRHTPVFCRKG